MSDIFAEMRRLKFHVWLATELKCSLEAGHKWTPEELSPAIAFSVDDTTAALELLRLQGVVVLLPSGEYECVQGPQP